MSLCQAHARYEQADFGASPKLGLLGQYLFAPDAPLTCLLVESEGEVWGYATLMKQFSTWDATFYIYLDCLFLREGLRGKGLGKQLMNIIKKYAQSLGCSQVQWQTPVFNERAIQFYQKLGAESKTKERYTWEI